MCSFVHFSRQFNGNDRIVESTFSTTKNCLCSFLYSNEIEALQTMCFVQKYKFLTWMKTKPEVQWMVYKVTRWNKAKWNRRRESHTKVIWLLFIKCLGCYCNGSACMCFTLIVFLKKKHTYTATATCVIIIIVSPDHKLLAECIAIHRHSMVLRDQTVIRYHHQCGHMCCTYCSFLYMKIKDMRTIAVSVKRIVQKTQGKKVTIWDSNRNTIKVYNILTLSKSMHFKVQVYKTIHKYIWCVHMCVCVLHIVGMPLGY